jgi:hypothetical protein
MHIPTNIHFPSTGAPPLFKNSGSAWFPSMVWAWSTEWDLPPARVQCRVGTGMSENIHVFQIVSCNSTWGSRAIISRTGSKYCQDDILWSCIHGQIRHIDRPLHKSIISIILGPGVQTQVGWLGYRSRRNSSSCSARASSVPVMPVVSSSMEHNSPWMGLIAIYTPVWREASRVVQRCLA